MTGWPASFNSSFVVKMRQRAIFSRFLYKNRFGEVHFARDGQHLIARKAVAVRDNGDRIALEASCGENVECEKAMIHLPSVPVSRRACFGSNPLELADSPFVNDIPC